MAMIHSAEHTFCYIDPSKKSAQDAAAGDGSSPSSPLLDFPTTLQDNVIYIVRKSNKEFPAIVQNNISSNNVTSLVIWGMPTPNDEHWSMVPAVARSAWGGDPADLQVWLKFQPNTDHDALNLPYCKYLDLRSFNMAESGYTYRYCIRVAGSSGRCNLYVDHVHFMNYDCDFTAGDQTLGNYYGAYFIHVDGGSYAHAARFLNSRIDCLYNGTCIYFGRQHNILIKNTDVHSVQHESRDAVFSWGADDRLMPNVVIQDCNNYVYMCNRHSLYLQPIYAGTCRTLMAKNITYQPAEDQYWPPYDNQVYMGELISCELRSPGSVIEDITANFPEWTAGGYYPIIRLSYRTDDTWSDDRDPSFGQYTIVRNINITMSRNPIYGDGTNNSGGYVWNTDGNNRGLIRLTRSGSRGRVASSDFLIQNISITAPRGIAMVLDNCLVDLKSCDIEGSCQFTHCVGKIGTITTWYPGYGVYDNAGNILYIKAIQCNRNNPNWEYNGQYALVPSYGSNILVGTTNVICMPSTFMRTDQTRKECSYICTNDQIAGNYTVRNSFTDCKTWSVNRVGSVGGCTLKLTNETTDDFNFPLKIGGEPFKGIAVQVAAGSHVAKIYAAMYGYNNFAQIIDRFQCKITLPDGTFVTAADGNWYEDTESSWENIEGHTVYRLEIPFELSEAGEVLFEYSFSWYMIGGATYLDPYPVIE